MEGGGKHIINEFKITNINITFCNTYDDGCKTCSVQFVNYVLSSAKSGDERLHCVYGHNCRYYVTMIDMRDDLVGLVPPIFNSG